MWTWYRHNIRLSHWLFLAIAVAGLSIPEYFTGSLQSVTGMFARYFDWFVMLVSTGFVLFCLFLAFSRYGHIRLGSQDEQPEYGTFSWLAMLFAAGMGAGLIFYGVAEPLFHMSSPPPTNLEQTLNEAMAARKAMAVTYLHWGLHAWAIYAFAALSIAYFAFRQQEPMLASSPVQGWLSIGNTHPLSQLLNLLAVLAVVFGLISSLGQGVTQMQSGAAHSGFSSGDKTAELLMILLLLTLCYIISSVTGLGKGIRILSNINITVCILLMLFIFITGPTHFILESVVTSLGDYLSSFIRLGLNLRPYGAHSDWVQDWTVTYFLWWIAWAPFVGIFIARISRGRTIRQFITGVLFVPTLFSCLWFSTLGGTAIYMDLFDGTNLAGVANNELSAAMFALLAELPWQQLTTLVTLFLIFIFLVTSADSGSFVLGMFTSEGNPNPGKFQRLFWGLIIAVITGITLLSGQGVAFLRAVALTGSIPYLLLMLMQGLAMWRFLRKDITELQQPFVQPGLKRTEK